MDWLEVLKTVQPLVSFIAVGAAGWKRYQSLVQRGLPTELSSRVDRFRDRDIISLRAELEGDPDLSPCVRELLRDTLETRILQKTLGVTAEFTTRGAIQDLRKRLGAEFRLNDIRLAWRFMEMKDGRLTVRKLRWTDRGWRVMNLFGWWLNVLMATASLLVAVYAAPRAPTIAALSGAQVILFIWLAGSSFTDYHGISAAIRMENKLRPVADPDVRALPADQSEEELLRAG